jgi:hypothetical protein
MHDINDNRYGGLPRSYSGHPLWKGAKLHATTGIADSRVNIGWMNSQEDQVIALADFASRNDLEIGSADHEYATFFEADAARADEMRRVLGDEFFSTRGHWAFLSLTGMEGPFHVPALSGWRAAANRAAVVSDQLPRLPTTVVTAPPGIHTWDAPESARVRIEDLSLAW